MVRESRRYPDAPIQPTSRTPRLFARGSRRYPDAPSPYCEGILGGTIEQAWVATQGGGFDRRYVEILPELPPVT